MNIFGLGLDLQNRQESTSDCKMYELGNHAEYVSGMGKKNPFIPNKKLVRTEMITKRGTLVWIVL